MRPIQELQRIRDMLDRNRVPKLNGTAERVEWLGKQWKEREQQVETLLAWIEKNVKKEEVKLL